MDRAVSHALRECTGDGRFTGFSCSAGSKRKFTRRETGKTEHSLEPACEEVAPTVVGSVPPVGCESGGTEGKHDVRSRPGNTDVVDHSPKTSECGRAASSQRQHIRCIGNLLSENEGYATAAENIGKSITTQPSILPKIGADAVSTAESPRDSGVTDDSTYANAVDLYGTFTSSNTEYRSVEVINKPGTADGQSHQSNLFNEDELPSPRSEHGATYFPELTQLSQNVTCQSESWLAALLQWNQQQSLQHLEMAKFTETELITGIPFTYI